MSKRVGAGVVAMLVAGAVVWAEASSDVGRTDHIRSTHQSLLAMVDEGMARSASFRQLVDRLDRSDVVVYLECDRRVTSDEDGRLLFVGVGGGYRYLVVRLRRLPGSMRGVAMLGHELQHAVEIAEAPDVVDVASLRAHYERIGHVSRQLSGGVAFDTRAAVDAGHRILRELTTRVEPDAVATGP